MICTINGLDTIEAAHPGACITSECQKCVKLSIDVIHSTVQILKFPERLLRRAQACVPEIYSGFLPHQIKTLKLT
jgi:hypothetical protein